MIALFYLASFVCTWDIGTHITSMNKYFKNVKNMDLFFPYP